MTLDLQDLAFLAASNSGPILSYPAYVQDYLDRVTAADVAAGNTSGLELGVTDAASSFLQDLVSVFYLGVSGNVISQAASVIKAMPIMAGARTRAGALVPVVGLAPTEFGTTSGWNYNRKTGLAANGIDNYLDSNRANNADPQDSQHQAAYCSTYSTAALQGIMGDLSGANAGLSYMYTSGNSGLIASNRCGELGSNVTPNNSTLVGTNRAVSGSYSRRINGSTTTISDTSLTPTTGNIHIFRLNRTSGNFLYGAHRIAFYSIGESLNLPLLEARVTTLINAYAAAIP